MSRYQLAPIGVVDTQLGVTLRIGDPGWAEYQAFVAAGGIADAPGAVSGPGVEEVRAEQLALVNNLRSQRLSAGLTFQGNAYDSDPDSRANLSAAVTMALAGAPLPEDFTWRTSDNIDVPFDAPTLIAFGGAMLAYGDACYNWSWQLKAQIKAADDPASIDITAGWPN